MGQKINPHGLRVGLMINWISKWYDEKFPDILIRIQNSCMKHWISIKSQNRQYCLKLKQYTFLVENHIRKKMISYKKVLY